MQSVRRMAHKRSFGSVSESECGQLMTDEDQSLQTSSGDYFASDVDGQFKRSRSLRDAQAHRMIEKRRRDRMNSCLSDLDQLIQASHPEHRQGRVEKTEIIEMAIQHINYLQGLANARRYEDGYVAGFRKCRDEAVSYLLEKREQESVDSDSMSLIAHLQNKLEKLPAELNSLPMNGVQQSPQFKLSPAATTLGKFLAKTVTIPHQTFNTSQGMAVLNNGYTDCYASEGAQIVCKLEATEVDADKISLESNSSSETTRTDSMIDSVVDWTQHLRTQANSTAESQSDGGEVRRGRRRSFSECSIPSRTYKFKNNMKVRFKEDLQDGSHFGSNDGFVNVGRLDDATKRSHTQSGDKETALEGDDLSTFPYIRDMFTKASTTRLSNEDSMSDLPAFVLYPGCTFYVPITLPASFVAPYLLNCNASTASHPICINVNFSCPAVQSTPPKTSSDKRIPASSNSREEIS